MAVTIFEGQENDILKWICKRTGGDSPGFYYGEMWDNTGHLIVPNAGGYPLSVGTGLPDGRSSAVGAGGNSGDPTYSWSEAEFTWQNLPACTVAELRFYNGYGIETCRMPITPNITVSSGNDLYLSSDLSPDPSDGVYLYFKTSTGVIDIQTSQEMLTAFNAFSPVLLPFGRHLVLYNGGTAITLGPDTEYNDPVWVTVSGGGMTNSNKIVWNDMPACTVTHWSIWSNADQFFRAPLSSSVSVSAGEKFVFEAGDLLLRAQGV